MNEKDEKRVVLKVDLPKKLKFQFKVICTQKKSTMSNVIEELILRWIQANAYTDNFISEPEEKDNEDLKGYISESLKIDFKTLCVQNKITMRYVLYNLIRHWILTEKKFELKNI